jgi:hypothetical protein
MLERFIWAVHSIARSGVEAMTSDMQRARMPALTTPPAVVNGEEYLASKLGRRRAHGTGKEKLVGIIALLPVVALGTSFGLCIRRRITRDNWN